MTEINLDSSARIIHEAIQQLGWSADPSAITERIKRLDIGLPAEDEFIFVLSWLGKCTVLHKLDQKQFPLESRVNLQVPDLLASFVTPTGHKLTLIEIKVSKSRKLSWKAEYIEKLKNYSALLGIPLLVAWKFYGIWILVDIDCFTKAKTNFHLSFDSALKNNLMNFLAGDFAYVMKPRVGLHFVMRKERMESDKNINHDTREETWLVKIEKAFFTNSEGIETSKMPNGLWPLFISAGPESVDRVEADRIYQSFTIPENQGINFAHAALPALINFLSKPDEKIHWRKQLEEHHFPVEIELFNEAAKEGIKEGYVQCILHIQPTKMPKFLEDKK